ncbi:outer membrane beta-barrel protein [Spirosoma validum]|uniref:Outer membrane beta-barrel protein n=1 Tax=Spirosoma validum TaxID=2771355 RepID=A0A927GBE7_9BACT|nr:outer membrane beta-barrel protein [Spirosoma validum]MBD2751524.1 outer membrane beta-barrel protein [Spirosoma validum]
MKLYQLWLSIVFLGSLSSALAQNTQPSSLEFGIKGGGTLTHGFTNIPAQTVDGVQIPAVENKSNGIGIGYTGGLWGRMNFPHFFIQAEVTYNRYVLKQKTDVTVDINANPALANALPVSVQPGLLNASLNAVSESVLESVDVPILVGKRWMDGRLRGYIGPNFIFVQKAEVTRTTSGQINANTNVGFPQTTIPPTTGTTDLRNKYVAQYLEVKDFTYAVELGAGYSLLNGLDIDVRYAVPVGGIYKDTKITGFLGIATVSLAFKVF